jgi:hypothetical protein
MPARGQHRLIGEPGRFATAADAIVMNGRLYTIDQDTHLYRWDLDRVSCEQIGSGSWDTRILLATPMWLLHMESSGSVYVVDPNSGNHSQIGQDGAWANATCAALSGPNELMICDDAGDIHALDITNHTHQIRSGGEGWGASNMFNGEGYVHILEPEGSVYKIDTSSGAYEQVDADGDWTGTTASDGANGMLYLCCEGGMYWKDTRSGEWGPIGEATTWAPTMLFLGHGCLYSFEGDGSLWEIGL